jgi:8-oxo-dGTP diphosphatase
MKTHNDEEIILTTKVLIEFKGRWLLVRRSDTHPTHPMGWDLPGGLIDPGEGPEEAVERETTEETGLNITDLQIQKADYINDDKHPNPVLSLIYSAKTDSEEVKLSWEHSEYRWLTTKEALGLDIRDKYRKVLKKLDT